jgi:hypothetical protein
MFLPTRLRLLNVASLGLSGLACRLLPRRDARNFAGGIWYPQLEQIVASDTFTFPRLIFFRAGIWGFYSGAVPKLVSDISTVQRDHEAPESVAEEAVGRKFLNGMPFSKLKVKGYFPRCPLRRIHNGDD